MESATRVPKTWLRRVAMLGALAVATGGLLALEQTGTGAAPGQPSHSASALSQAQANRASSSTKILSIARESHGREETHHSTPPTTKQHREDEQKPSEHHKHKHHKHHHDDDDKPPKHCDDEHGRDREKNKHCRPASG